MRRLPLLLALIIISFSAVSQNTIGIPNIINYSRHDYQAGSQNWDIAQDKNGIMYFANNNGMLSYDGASWRMYQLPNKTIVRSLAIDSDGKIYTGGQAEIGYFAPDEKGELIYTSLNNLLKEKDNDFTDVWNISIFNGHVFFRANKKILELYKGKIFVHKSINWSYMGSSPRGILAYDYENGLVRWERNAWVPAFRFGSLPKGLLIKTATVIGKDSVLLASVMHGLYILENDSIKQFDSPDIKGISSKNIFGAALLSHDKIALITNLAGCFVVNKQGKFIQRFTKKEGIQNNNILSMRLDRDKNLWLGLDNGIDLITYSNAIKNIFPEQDDRNAGYTSIIHQNQLYLGISTGVYKINLQAGEKDLSYVTGNFQFVENSKGQTWNLSEVDGKLLMGHNKGAFEIQQTKAFPIDNATGFWQFQSLKQENAAPVIIAGTYNGINFYHNNNGRVTNPKVHAQFESARFLVQNNDVIWAAHPYKGLYKISYRNGQAHAVMYEDKNKILSSNHNKLFRLGNKMILTSDNGIFEFDEKSNDFKHAVVLEKKVGNLPVSYLKEDADGNLWFCRDRKVGVVDKTGKTTFIPEIDDKIMAAGFENINIIDSNNVFVGAEKGFYHINFSEYRKNKQLLKVLVRSVESPLQKENLIYGGYRESAQTPSIKHQYNSLHFECAPVVYGQQHNTEYSYYLEGFDKSWSPWAKKTERDYTNLPAGNYVFKVKCRNNFDNESKPSSFSFTILPPWYQTWWAYGLYATLFFGAIYFFYKRQQQKYKKLEQLKLQEQQRKYDEEQRRLQYQHQIEIEKNEKEIVQLKNEKLQAEIEQKNLEEEQKRIQFQHQLETEKQEKEIINLKNENLQAELEHKNAELASSAMNMVRKIELFSKLKEDLHHHKHQIEDEKGQKEFQKIIKTIDKELDYDKEWEQFAIHFDSVHTNYLKKLKEYCPDLTASELKMAAYLRLNLSSKEIAQLMNISIRGVETSRYRLRKKLALQGETSLSGFLSGLDA